MPKTNIKYTTIYDWMFQLDLTATELHIYAVIYNYCTANPINPYYSADQGSIGEFIHVEQRNVNRAMQSLYNKGLIEKELVEKRGCMKIFRYKTVVPKNDDSQIEIRDDSQIEIRDDSQIEIRDDSQIEIQYINNIKEIYNNNNTDPTTSSEQLEGQIEFKDTKSFDEIIDNTDKPKHLHIQLKKKIMELLACSTQQADKIIEKAMLNDLTEQEIIHRVEYSLSQHSTNRVGKAIYLMMNFKEPVQNAPKTGFNNFDGRQGPHDPRYMVLFEKIQNGTATDEERKEFDYLRRI